MQGLRGSVRASGRRIAGSSLRPLPEIRESRPELQGIAENLAAAGTQHEPDDRESDVFVSHASEDKEAVVRPLAQAIRDAALQVWFDEFELRIGDSLRRKIDKESRAAASESSCSLRRSLLTHL